MTTRTAYRIYFATGTPFQKDTYTAAEAAQIVAGHPWAWVDRAGDIIVSNYRDRTRRRRVHAGHRPADGRPAAQAGLMVGEHRAPRLYDCCEHCEHGINDPPHNGPCPEGCAEAEDGSLPGRPGHPSLN